MHEILELVDLKNPNYDIIDDDFYKKTIEKFLNNDILKNISQAKVYKEYEFIYEIKEVKYHGIIDLMLEYDDHIDIIDYKLKNTNDGAYNEQLKGYRDYIKTKTTKNINLYLYSLLDGNFFEIV